MVFLLFFSCDVVLHVGVNWFPISLYNYIKKCMKLIALFYLDPHVKVEGKRDNVVEAKNKILEVLETKVKAVRKILMNTCFHFHLKMIDLIQS